MARPIRTLALVVVEAADAGPGIRRLVLQDPDQWPLPPFRPGAHIDLHLADGLVRTYSLCNEPQDSTRYVVAVKREDAGRGGSHFIHEQLQVGDPVGVSLPRGGFEPGESGTHVFIAGGIGITPFLSAIQAMERRSQSNYVLHWSGRGGPCLPDALPSSLAAGRVTFYDTLRGQRPDLARILGACTGESRAYCCGPTAMLDAFERAVAHWPPERKHVERFVAPVLAPSATSAPYEVVLARSRKQAAVLPEVGLLRTLEALGADVTVSCGGGICGACRTRWLEGPPVHRDRVLTPAEREKDVIVCVAECAAPRLVLDL